MLTGPQLGAAIEAARKKKGVTKKALAEHFGISQPSIQDWVKRGTIDKQKLPGLWAYFADVVDLAHWGLGIPVAQTGWNEASAASPGGPAHVAREPPPPFGPTSLAQALPVVLQALAGGLSDYRAGQIMQALQAATKPGAPLADIERDLLTWLSPPEVDSEKHRGAA